jgi:hypothetical protein
MSTVGGGVNIATNGLVLYLDAANTKSYISGSTTWLDVSRSGNNGTLVNGPTFSSRNGGGIVLDGTNDYISLGNTLNYTSENFTFSIWVFINSLSTNSAGQGPILFYKGAFNVNGYYTQIGQNGNIIFVTNNLGVSQVSSINANTISTGNIYNISFTRNGTSARIYVNGIDVTTTIGTHSNPTTSSSTFTIGSYNLTQIVSNATIFNFLNYNRALTATEVLQNYNATRTRFGL